VQHLAHIDYASKQGSKILLCHHFEIVVAKRCTRCSARAGSDSMRIDGKLLRELPYAEFSEVGHADTEMAPVLAGALMLTQAVIALLYLLLTDSLRPRVGGRNSA
jgi:hypothetical protein